MEVLFLQTPTTRGSTKTPSLQSLRNPPSLEDHPSKWFSNLHSFSHLSPFEREIIFLGSVTPLLFTTYKSWDDPPSSAVNSPTFSSFSAMATWLQLSAKKMVSTFQEHQTKRKIRIMQLVSMETFEPLRIITGF